MKTSSKKPAKEPAPKPPTKQSPDDALITFGDFSPEVTVEDEQVSALQQSLADEKDSRLEERFVWVLATTTLAYALIAVAAPLSLFPITPLWILGLIFAAQKCGVEALVVPLQQLWAKIMRRED